MRESKLLTVPRAAKTLGLSVYGVREAVRRGELAAVRPNPRGQPLIEREELARWANSIGLQEMGDVHGTISTRGIESESPELWTSGREELARDFMGVLERRSDCVRPHVLRQIRQVLEHLLV